MTCYKPGQRSRLIYAIRECCGRKDEPKGLGWKDFRDLTVRARTRLGGPIVLVWDNVRLNPTAGMRDFINANARSFPADHVTVAWSDRCPVYGAG
ncbi:DDE endonuclease [Kitasatospora cheerisanensis KCTC 2395]|uniref:DDE endonuclease n=1 Tax=Kitasatospora cheerisanensis KCTC 2395 TaxID=1348663 RepID=A0A066Z3A4_9ACTN|nr:hypothetical protein [Kitasatospora cheerisanensis]KDN88238.1 DDE endonuclease [Kitasatospora cheerisanensis KCTC 2395]